MNWKEFKKYVESHNIDDNTEITYIDTNMYNINIHFNEDGSAHIE